MKTKITFVLIFLIANLSGISLKKINHYIPTETKVVYIDEIKELPPPPGLNDFLTAIAYKESNNRHYVINRFGYMGKYQFSFSLIKRLGYDITRYEFLNNSLLQDEVMITLLNHNKEILEDFIYQYDGSVINGNQITKSGILAAAHLLGPYRTRRYLQYGEVSQDGNGTSITEYLHNFSGYSFNL